MEEKKKRGRPRKAQILMGANGTLPQETPQEYRATLLVNGQTFGKYGATVFDALDQFNEIFFADTLSFVLKTKGVFTVYHGEEIIHSFLTAFQMRRFFRVQGFRQLIAKRLQVI